MDKSIFTAEGFPTKVTKWIGDGDIHGYTLSVSIENLCRKVEITLLAKFVGGQLTGPNAGIN